MKVMLSMGTFFIFLILLVGLSYGATDEELAQYRQRVKDYPNLAEAHLQLALAYDENQKLAQAKEEYIQAISINDTLQVAYVNIAVICLREENYSDAANYFQKALALNPVNKNALSGMAYLYLMGKDYDKAIDFYGKAIKIAPEDPSNYYNLALCYEAKENTALAILNYQKCLDKDPNYSKARFNLALIYLDRGEETNAISQLEEAIAVSPADLDTRLKLAELLEKNGDLKAALDNYNIAMEVDYYNWELKLKAASLNERLGKEGEDKNEMEYLREAERLYTLIKDSNPENADLLARSHAGLARVYTKMGMYTSANDQMEEAKTYGVNVAGDAGLYMELARQSHREKNYESAISQYEKALELDPNIAEAHLALGQIYFIQGRLDEAEQKFKKVLEIEPSNKKVHFYLGFLYHKEQKIDEAIEEYRLAIAYDPSNDRAHQNLGFIYVQLGNDAYQKAETMIIPNKKLSEKQEAALQSQIAEGDKYYQKAMVEFEEAVVLSPQNVQSNLALAEIYELRGKEIEAIDQYRQVANLDPKISKAQAKLGLYYGVKEKNYDRGRFYFERALQNGLTGTKRDSSEFYSDFAKMLVEAGNYTEATDNANLALKIDPRNADAFCTLGAIYERQQFYDMAIQNYKQAISLDFTNSHYHFVLGKLYEKQNDIAKAKQEYSTAVRFDKNNVEADLRLAYIVSGQKEIREYEKMLDKDSENDVALTNLGALWVKAKQFDRAKSYFLRAIKQNDANYIAHFNLGLLYDIDDDFASAITEYKKSINLNPNFVKAYYNLGDIYERQGMTHDAILQYEKAFQIDPTHKGVIKRLNVLLEKNK